MLLFMETNTNTYVNIRQYISYKTGFYQLRWMDRYLQVQIMKQFKVAGLKNLNYPTITR